MNDSSKQPPERLAASAHPAWQTYIAMVESKQTHFAYLDVLEVKYRNGGRRTLAEISHLEGLLAQHDQCVKAFAQSIKALAEKDETAHQDLLALIGELNRELGAANASH